MVMMRLFHGNLITSVGAALAAILFVGVLFAAKAAPTGERLRVMKQVWFCVLLCAWFVISMPAALADEHIKGGCTIGASDAAHGRSDPEAVMDMQRFANLYVSSFQKYRKTERTVRLRINELLALEQWTQADIVTFTKQQRELLYLSVGMRLANGRTTADELPGYASEIRKRITDIEIELGCDMPAGS